MSTDFITKPAGNLLGKITSSPHTSYPAIGYGVVKTMSIVSTAWFPDKAAQIRTTSDALEAFCIVYLGCAAAETKKPNS